MKKTPKYAQIEAELIAQIESGQLAPGAELPGESDLIECYGVSRVTVRRAIDELYHQGYVEKMQGKRACVKEKVKLQELTSISSYTEEIIRQGMTPSRKLLSFGLRVCTKEEAEQLGLKKADPVFFMERIYFADGSPLCLTSTVLPYQLFREIETYDFEQNSLYQVLEEQYHIQITTTSLKLKAVSAYGNISRFLNVEEDTPLLYSDGITYGIQKDREVPIELFQNYYLTSRFEYSLIQRR